MTGDEERTKSIIDGIELYDSVLDESGRKFLTNFVLKSRLTENAKIRLRQTYDSNELLIADLRKNFIEKQSIPTISSLLHNATQSGTSIESFGKKIEDLMVNLTISEADGNMEVAKTLRHVNERIAIHTFASGLENIDLRTIVKARNYQSMSEAIQGAKDEELPTSKIYNIKGRNHQDNYNNRRPWKNTQTKYLENNPHVPRGFQNAYSSNKSHVNFGTRKPPFRNYRNKKPTHNTFNCSEQEEKSNMEESQTFFRGLQE
ncbi:hypothetical protein WA026_004070 [Henosepilachna vigintioctopunctata]|uniref:Uncharacterized protein n=1 Tax=Henosepilachna vigintioctopunctata TaxID=420089 RepID=A0AAW1UII6_9CUCU